MSIILFLAFATSGSAHMGSMDAYFSCLFAVVRSERQRGSDVRSFSATLSASCNAEEATLRERSIKLFKAKGRSQTRAEIETDQILAKARRDMIQVFVRR